MSYQYVLSQIFICFGYIFFGIGMQKKNKVELLKYNCVFYFFISLGFILLGSIVGLISPVCGFFRNMIFIHNEKRNKQNSVLILILLSLIAIFFTTVLYESPVDLIPCLLTIIGIVSYWCKVTKFTRIGTCLLCILSIIFSFSINSWFTIICESYVLIATVIGFMKYNVKKNNEI